MITMRPTRLSQISIVAVMKLVLALASPAMSDAQATDPTVRKSFERADWRRLPAEQLKELIVASSLTYGLQPTPIQLQSRADLYQHFVARVPLEERVETADVVSRKIEKGLSAVQSLEPFIYYDPAFAVVSSATLNLAVLMPLRQDDQMTGPKYVCQLMRSVRNDQTRGQMLAGLLILGDRRVTPIVRQCFKVLGPAGRQELAVAWSGFAYKSVVDFMLDWLDEAVEREDEFGSVAGTLARLAIQAQPRAVLDVRRKFPASAATDGAAVEVLQKWQIREYGQMIAPRLRALAKREREPKVIPVVMVAWGIE